MKDEQMLTQSQAAEFLALSPVTLEKMRMRGDGPRYVKYGTARSSPIRYAPADLRKYLQDCSRRCTVGVLGNERAS